MPVNYPKLNTMDEDEVEFLNQLNSQDEKVRFITIMNIADEEREEYLAWLHYALAEDPSELVRIEAAKRLEGWEDRDSLLALAHALTDRSSEVVIAATQSLSEVKNTQSAEVLAPFLDSEVAAVKVAILCALKPLRVISLYEKIQAHIHHSDVFVRREAVSALSWLQLDQALDGLAEIAQHDPDLETRRIATGALAYSQQPNTKVINALQHTLTAPDWQLRVEAALTIGKLKLKELEDQLIALLHDTYWQVRIPAVRSLGLLKSEKSLAGLAENFFYEISNLRKEVALALGEIGGAEARRLLQAHESDPDPEVRKSIRIGLAQIRENEDATTD